MVVRQFYISKRTFQRKLLSEGTSYRKIVNEIKKDLSIFLQKGKPIKTKELAYLLGYSESSAYLHALNKWKYTNDSSADNR